MTKKKKPKAKPKPASYNSLKLQLKKALLDAHLVSYLRGQVDVFGRWFQEERAAQQRLRLSLAGANKESAQGWAEVRTLQVEVTRLRRLSGEVC